MAVTSSQLPPAAVSTPSDPSLEDSEIKPITFVHRFAHDKSILALAVAGNLIYAGTQGGEILIFDPYTFERVRVIEAHNGAVLGFCSSEDGSYLFSCAGDRFVNVWNTQTSQHEAAVYSSYDVGDVFCVSYSSRKRTLWLGCQNTAVQWINFKGDESSRPPNPRSHPSFREDRFFDSFGPGGVRTPRSGPPSSRKLDRRKNHDLEIPPQNIVQFAHYGYIFAMMLATTLSTTGTAQETLITGGGDGIIKLWSISECPQGRPTELHVLGNYDGDEDAVVSLVKDSTFLFSGRANGKVDVWDLETRQLVRSMQSHFDEVLALSLINGSLIASHNNGSLRAFNQRQEKLMYWRGHKGRVLASAQMRIRDRHLLFTGSNDNTLAVWNATSLVEHGEDQSLISHSSLLDALQTYVSHKTVSSDTRYRTDCRKGASYLRSLLRALGASTELLISDDDHNPVVLGRFKANKLGTTAKETILFYGHYDVVAAENKRGTWTNDPFTLTGADGYLYGRGVSDNKGPTLASIFAVAGLVAEKALASDVVFLVEGEEECGSKGFEAIVKKHKPIIGKIDWILLANSYWLDDEYPCLTYGLRGVIQLQVEVMSDEPDLHSGVDGSLLLDEPLKDLTTLVATLTGPDRRVQIPGFYDSIPAMTDDERAFYEDITRYLLSKDSTLGPANSLADSIIRRTRDPSLTLHSFRTSGSDKATIIPRHATASISMRLVPNQDVEDIAASLTTYLEAQFTNLKSKNHLTVRINHQAQPWVADYRNNIYKSLERIVTDVWSESASAKSTAQRPSSRGSGNGSTKSNDAAVTNITPPAPATSSKLAAAVSPQSPLLAPSRKASLDEATKNLSLVESRSETLPSAIKTSSLPRPHTAADTSAQSWKPLYVREGGTIPAVRFLEKEFNAPAAHLPCGQASDNAHLDNERFRMLNLLNSREIFARVFGTVRLRP